MKRGKYLNGDIRQAKQALPDHFRLVEEEETSGLPFAKGGLCKSAKSIERLGDSTGRLQAI